MTDQAHHQGAIAWMARNHVAANLLMAFFLIGGILMASGVKQEVFPEVDLKLVTVRVVYPGATPTEVEQGIVLALEEAVRGLDGVKEIRASATEGLAFLAIELFTFADSDEVLNEVKSAVDRIASFPRDAEEPVIQLASNRQEVISLIVYGDLDLRSLKKLSEEIRSDLLHKPQITAVEIMGIPAPEISIEVPQENLRRYNLTLPALAGIVGNASVNLSAGSIETDTQEILVRVSERRRSGDAYRDIAVVTTPAGDRVTLGQIATVVDGFEDTNEAAFYNGQAAARIKVYRVGDQTPIDIAETVKTYQQEQQATLPPGIHLAIWNDSAQIYSERIGLLIENGRLGALLVLIILGLFLQPRIALWVTVGMPVTFLGAFLFMPVLDVSINMISLFAFLLVLGIVVDDAIVVGEATHSQMSRGKEPLPAAVDGVYEVIKPVTFAVLTTLIAFTPLLFVPGVAGDFFRNIPLIVIPILLLSLLESFFILPAHLGHSKHGTVTARRSARGWRKKIAHWREHAQSLQRRFAEHFTHLQNRYYSPLIARAITFRYLTVAIALAVLIIAVGLPAGGHIAFNFLPKLQGDIVSVDITLPAGSTGKETQAVMQRVIEAANAIVDQHGSAAAPLSKGIYAQLGGGSPNNNDPAEISGLGNMANRASVAVELVPSGQRDVSAKEFSDQWRQQLGAVVGVDNLRFNYDIGPSAGAKVAIELAHENRDVLRLAASRLAEQLQTYAGVSDIDEGFSQGKQEIQLKLKPAARVLGVTEADLARQVRGAFFGNEALREQRGRDELRVYVRLPLWQRDSEHRIGELIIFTPEGAQMTLQQAAYIERTNAFTEITRENARRVVEVTADIDPEVTSGGKVTASLTEDALPALLDEFAGLNFELSGEQQEQARTLSSLGLGMTLAILAMYMMMAVAFRSYVQPVIVLAAVPFGIVGAMLGHLLMGYELSLVSMLGLVALAGVVVNDSLVLVTSINDFRSEENNTLYEAVINGTQRRFRPVVLTSLTTFFGLAPIIFETSLQARFLIPMAISLGFGVLFVSLIILIIVPTLYYLIEDVKGKVQQRQNA